MTSEILSNNQGNQEKVDGFLNKNLLWDNIKRHKVLIIITGIVMFFASPFIEILAYTTKNNLQSYYPYENFYQYVESNIIKNMIFGLMIAVSITFGLFLAVSVMRYMHDRKALVFFSSIPIKKRILFSTQCLSGLIYFTAPLILIYLISIAILPSYVTFITLTKIFSISFFLFLLIYSFIIMCANIAGTSLNTVISTIFLALIAAGVFGIFVFFVDSFYRFTSISAITNNIPRGIWLPVLYFIVDIIEKWITGFQYSALIDMLFLLLVSAAFLFIGGLLNRINKTENAEKSFYSKISQTIFKYTLLAIAVILTGIMFYQILYQSVFYMILGVVIGGFIAFLLINFVIYRNIREIFTGLKRFGIFILAASVVMTVFSFDIFGIDKYMPKISDVENVKFSGGYNYGFDYSIYTGVLSGNSERGRYDSYDKIINDPETIELLSNVLKAAMKSTPGLSPDYFQTYQENGTISISGAEIRYKLKNGAFVNKKIPSSYFLYFKNDSDRDEYKNAERLLHANKKFKEAYFAPITNAAYMDNLINTPGISFEVTFFDYSDNVSHAASFDKNDMMRIIESLNQDILSDIITMNPYDDGVSYRIDITISMPTNSQKDVIRHEIYFSINGSFKNTIELIKTVIANENYIQ